MALAVDDSRLRVIRPHSRVGMAGNWGRCVRLSGGEYVKFLMQDDRLDPTSVSKMADILSRHPSAGFVFAPRRIGFDDSTDRDSSRLAHRLERLSARLGSLAEVNDGIAIFETIRRTGFRANLIGEPTSVMVRRDAFRRIGLFNAHLRQLTDLEMWLRLAYFFDVGFIAEPLSTFTLHSTSATSSNQRGGDAWLDAAWLLEGLRAHPEIRPHLGAMTEARVWSGVLIAEGARLFRGRFRSGHSYGPTLREYLRYRRHPTRDLHDALDRGA